MSQNLREHFSVYQEFLFNIYIYISLFKCFDDVNKCSENILTSLQCVFFIYFNICDGAHKKKDKILPKQNNNKNNSKPLIVES